MIKYRLAPVFIAIFFIFSGSPPGVLPMAQSLAEHSQNNFRPKSSASGAPVPSLVHQDFQSIIQERLARGRFRSTYRKTSPIAHTLTRNNERRRIGTESRNSESDKFSPYSQESLVRSQEPYDQYPETYPRRLVHRRNPDPALR